MSATNLLVTESRSFCFKWRHQDGSTVEFNPSGWASDDPLKADWLLKMNGLCSSRPTICPAVRFWLREYCELIDFRCSERIEASGPRVPAHSFPSLARVSSLRISGRHRLMRRQSLGVGTQDQTIGNRCQTSGTPLRKSNKPRVAPGSGRKYDAGMRCKLVGCYSESYRPRYRMAD
jgi:hypothetical protein